MNACASLKLSFQWGGAALGDWMQRSPHERFGSFHWSKLVGHDKCFQNQPLTAHPWVFLMELLRMPQKCEFLYKPLETVVETIVNL